MDNLYFVEESGRMKLSTIIETTFYKIINFIFLITFLSVSCLIIFVSPSLNYMCKKTFLFPNVTLLLFDFLVFFIILIIWRTFRNVFLGLTDKNSTNFILIGSIVLFLAQLYVSYNIYFLTDWDVGYAVIPAAKMIVSGIPLDTPCPPYLPTGNVNTYFSIYPNNITLVWIFSKILQANAKFGILDTGNGLMSIITVNCFISSLSSILTYKCVEKLINKKWAIFSWSIYVLFIGTSPWVVITYSDAFALFLPILLFFVYTRDFSGKYIFLKWFLIGIISFLGYYIKPQVIIMLIAIVIVEIWRFVFLSKVEKKKTFFIVGTLIFTFFLSSLAYKAMYKQSGFNINTEDAFGMTHFAMMGLNNKTDGVWYNNDVEYSGSFATSSDRMKANIKVIKDRLENYGIFGYLKFLVKKTLVNYGDGTFAWGIEGKFYMEKYPDKNEWISPTLKSFYYTDGANYDMTSTFEQALWVGVIVSMLGLIFTEKRQMNNKIVVLMLAILGLTAFELLFEARARYLYIYAPIYLILSMLGLNKVVFTIAKLKLKNS
jgi:hypothetical protein